MYETYLIIAIVHLIFGIISVSYIVFLMYNVKSKSLLQLSESLTTISIGVLYLCGFILLSNNPNFKLFNNNTTEFVDLLPNKQEPVFYLAELQNVNRNEYDIIQNKIEEIKRELLNSNSAFENDLISSKTNINMSFNTNERKASFDDALSLNKHKERALFENHSTELFQNDTTPFDCNYEEILLEHAMLVYSFMHGLMTLINATYECKIEQKRTTKLEEIGKNKTIRINVKSKNNEDDDDVRENTARPEQNIIKKKINIVLYILIGVSWIIPAFTTGTICLICDCGNQINDTTHENIMHVLKPLNVTINNKTEVNKIVEKVYNIVKKATTEDIQNNYTPIMNKIINDLNKRKDRSLKDIGQNQNFKIHTFMIFILFNFLTILYVNIQYAKMQSCVSSKKLKIFIYIFILNWTPAVLETFSRVYINDVKPHLISDLVLALGNLHKMLLNFIKLKEINKTKDIF